MNRSMSLIALMLCCIASIAQTATEHLTFKGVPIDGSLKQYVSKMKSVGFSYIGTEDGTAVLKGDFAGFKGCLIGVSTLKNSDTVNTVGVIFPKKDNWTSLEENYLYLKKMLTEKYGEPAACVEEFKGYGYPDDNRDKLYRLGTDECVYVTVFETPKGDIQLSLDHRGVISYYVKLQYWDKINTDAVNAEAMDDL